MSFKSILFFKKIPKLKPSASPFDTMFVEVCLVEFLKQGYIWLSSLDIWQVSIVHVFLITFWKCSCLLNRKVDVNK